MEELKPCPFCGCDQIQDREREGEYLGFNKYCRNCLAEGPHAMTYEEAACKWNEREHQYEKKKKYRRVDI